MERTRPRGSTMTAAVLTAPGTATIEQVPRPEPARGQVLIRLEGCGVCASNLAPWEGAPWFDYPFTPGAPGHEGWGAVESVGAGVSRVRPGDRVATLADHAHAEYCVAEADQVVPLPGSFAGRPFPGEPLGCAMNIHARSGIRPGQTVAIVGAGFLGALLTQLASRDGARVIALSRRPYSLEVARQAGATDAIELGDAGEMEQAVADLTGGELCDRVIEAAGAQAALDVASRLARVRGRLIIAGFHQGGPRSVDMQLWNWRGLDVINAHERDPSTYVRGIAEAIEAVSTGRMDPWPLLTHRYSLAELGAALDATARRPAGFVKALVMTDDS